MSKTYQSEMDAGTKHVDDMAEANAKDTTVENYGVKRDFFETQSRSGQTYQQLEGTFGMVPDQSIDLGYTHERADEFKNMAEETGTHRNPLTGWGSAKDMDAYKTQNAMAQNYLSDLSRLPEVQKNFDMFAPMANIAARSYQKTNGVADQLGFTELKGPQLNDKDNAALGKVSKDKDGPVLKEGNSLHLAARDMQSARMGVVNATNQLASVVTSEATEALQQELEKDTQRKETIQKEIETASKIGEYIETAGTIIAGGAGLAGLAEKEGTEKVEAVGEVTEEGGSVGGKLGAFAVELYHSKELNRINTNIEVVMGMLKAQEYERNRKAILTAKGVFTKAAHDYETAVEKYQSLINDRRATMAAVGANADKALGKPGKDHHVSEATLYATTLLETQSFLEVAIDAANASRTTNDDVGNTVRDHRFTPWGTLSDALTGNNTPRTEGLDAPDVAPMRHMQDLVSWWLHGATMVKDTIDGVVEQQATPMLNKANYDGKF